MFGGRQNQNTGGNIQQHVQTVESILSNLGINPVDARMDTEQGYGWTFQRGSAVIEMYVVEQHGREYFQVLAPIMYLPMSGLLPLYRRLLELNLQISNASIGVHLDIVYIFNERPVAGLDAQEANFIIDRISEYADDLDNQLINEFGGRLYSQAN
jgi:hypothetical protein